MSFGIHKVSGFNSTPRPICFRSSDTAATATEG
jgi:hypothetical protein